MYTIFVNENIIYLDDKPSDNNEITTVAYTNCNLNEIIDQLENNSIKNIHIYNDNLKILWKDFQSYFKIIEAAGGLVFNENNKILWIYRHDKWDLPKGKIEITETIETAALREVEEECGVTNLQIKGLITITYHVYTHSTKRILKPTYWYKMTTDYTKELIPQIEEGITRVEWIDINNLESVLKNTYGNIYLLCKFAIL